MRALLCALALVAAARFAPAAVAAADQVDVTGHWDITIARRKQKEK